MKPLPARVTAIHGPYRDIPRPIRASNARDLPGYGLGLMVVRQIVDLHRGELAIESELDSGTQVLMTLPNGG